MLYKDAFAMDNIQYNKRHKVEEKEEIKHQLCNFDYYEPKLIGDFYLKYFIYRLLFATDILELKDFLEYHNDYCDNPEKYYMLLELKVIPKIEEIIDTAQLNPYGRGYFEEKELSDGFVETEGVIKNWDYDYPHMLHYVAALNLQKDLEKRVDIISYFVNGINNASVNHSGLNWKGKPSHLAFFIAQFIEEGYIDPPRKRDGDINNQELSKMILNSFRVETMKPSVETLKKYSNTDSERYIKLNERFKESDFFLPNSKIME